MNQNEILFPKDYYLYTLNLSQEFSWSPSANVRIWRQIHLARQKVQTVVDRQINDSWEELAKLRLWWDEHAIKVESIGTVCFVGITINEKL